MSKQNKKSEAIKRLRAQGQRSQARKECLMLNLRETEKAIKRIKKKLEAFEGDFKLEPILYSERILANLRKIELRLSPNESKASLNKKYYRARTLMKEAVL